MRCNGGFLRLLGRFLYVLAADASAHSATVHFAEVNRKLACELANDRRDVGIGFSRGRGFLRSRSFRRGVLGSGRSFGRLGGRGRLSRCGRCRSGAVANVGEHRTHGDRFVLLHQDLLERAGGGGRNFGIDLIGGDLQQRIAFGNLLALFNEPRGDRTFVNRFTERGHLHLDGVATGGCRSASRLLGGLLDLLGFGLAVILGGGNRCALTSGRARGRGFFSSGASSGSIADVSKNGSNLDLFILLYEDLLQNSLGGRRNFRIDLVGRNLEDWFIKRNRVSHVLEPGGYRSGVN